MEPTPLTDEDREYHAELARRLAAAYISWHMGDKKIDTAYKRHEAEKLGDFWIQLAKYVERSMLDSQNRKAPPDIEEVWDTSHPMGRFLQARCIQHSNERVRSALLYSAYR